jgi:DNA-3-methyladenine glycosylase
VSRGSAGEGRPLPRAFYARDPRLVAPELLGKVLRRGDLAARIVEVEAYCGSEDPASHAFRGPTARNASMFGPAGHLYVYFTYGMHWCANVVCGDEGVGVAVLLRAAEPLAGLEAMYRVRPAAKRDTDLCSGPAKLAQAFGLDRAHDGADLAPALGPGVGAAPDRVTIVDDGEAPPGPVVRTGRVGIRRAVEVPWRWYVGGNPHVSGPR